MKRNIISALLGILIGLPIAVCSGAAREVRAADNYYVSAISDTSEQIQQEIKEGELMTLACLVHAEAGNQDMHGKRLVVDVVLNRVEDPAYPDTITGVIFQPGQFAPVSDGALERAYVEVTDDDFAAVRMEALSISRIDKEVLFFTAGGYGKYGTPAYQYGDHYFSK